MNKLIALTTLIVLLKVVSSGESPLCRLFEGNSEKTAMFWDCMNSHFPAVAVNIVNRCHHTSFASAEATGNYLGAICDEDRNQDEIRAMENCMNEARSEIDGLEDDVIRSAVVNTESCYMEKTGLTRKEFERILYNRYEYEEK